ncbi:MAG: histidine kinase [Candidatus Hydrogenedentota bacterium]
MRRLAGKIIDKILSKLNSLKNIKDNAIKDEILEELEDLFDELIIFEGKTGASLSKTVDILEKERKRVSHEIHDGPAQVIAAVVRRIEYCESLLESETIDKTKIINELRDIKNDLRREIAELRTLIFSLRPPALDDLGLKSAVSSLVNNLKREREINIEFTGDDWVQLTKEAELNIYRIIQEALNNIWKYSDTTSVRINFQITEAVYEWIIEDFGTKEIEVEPEEKLIEKGKAGLIHMLERAELMNAELLIQPKKEGGLSIIIRLPKTNSLKT